MPVALEEEELFLFLSVLVGASRGASPALVPQRQERAAAPVVLSVHRHVTVGSLSTQSECMKHISWLCPGDPGKNAFVREQYGFISLFLSPVLSVGVRATSLLTCCVNSVRV